MFKMSEMVKSINSSSMSAPEPIKPTVPSNMVVLSLVLNLNHATLPSATTDVVSPPRFNVRMPLLGPEIAGSGSKMVVNKTPVAPSIGVGGFGFV